MTNIGKACEACRVRKTRCDGKEPCARCVNRSVSCIYRSRTRNRPRKSQTPATATVSSSGASNADETPGPSAHESHDKPKDDNSWGFHVHSVAAITTSPSSIIQLHYGPSSNFSMLHSIYRLITGIQTPLTRREEVAQVGPGLDLFQNRQLFFGDLADGKSTTISNDYSAMFLDKELCNRVLERYLSTFWHLLPILTKDDFRRRAELLYSSPGLFSFDSPDIVVVMLAMAIGASILEEEAMAQFLFQRASQGADKLDELVNIQAIHIPLLQAQFQLERSRPHSAFLYVGVASRKAVAAGLHRGISIRGQMRDCLQRRLTFWSLFIMETYAYFLLISCLTSPAHFVRIHSLTSHSIAGFASALDARHPYQTQAVECPCRLRKSSFWRLLGWPDSSQSARHVFITSIMSRYFTCGTRQRSFATSCRRMRRSNCVTSSSISRESRAQENAGFARPSSPQVC